MSSPKIGFDIVADPPDHFVPCIRDYEMAYFSIPLNLAGTTYIQSESLAKAQTKLDQVLSRSIDARDKRWFSDAPYGTMFLPEFSFSTTMTLFKPEPGQSCSEIDDADVVREMLSREHNRKSAVLPNSPDWYGEGKLPIYTADLDVRTTGFIRATSLHEAEAFAAQIEDTGVHWEVANQWFEIDGLNEEYPLILSPNMTVAGVAKGDSVSMRWPEDRGDFEYAAKINADIEKLAEGLNAGEIGALAKRLRYYFSRSGPSFSLLADDDILQIAGQLVDYRIQKQAHHNSFAGACI